MTHEIKVCMGSACFAKGNQENLEYIKEFIEENGLDAKIKIIGSLCENKCSVGPRIYIDDVELSSGLKMRYGRIQAMFMQNMPEEEFYSRLYQVEAIAASKE